MARFLVIAAGLAAGLTGLSGCSRTGDGSVVPAYRMEVVRYAGLPVLTMRRTPREVAPRLDAPSAFPPPPRPPLAGTAKEDASPPEQPKPRRVAARRVAPVSAVPATPERALQCRDGASGERAVSIVCE